MKPWTLIKLLLLIAVILCGWYYLRIVLFYIMWYMVWIIGAIVLGVLGYIFFKFVKVK